MSSEMEVRQSYETLRKRVTSVARRHCRVAVADGASRTALALLVPLLATLALDNWLGLHYLLRAAIVLAVAGVTSYLLVRGVVLPLLKRYTLTEAAMLVETGLPDLNGLVVSSLEVFDDLAREQPHFDRGMVCALIAHAQDTTRDTDFGRVIETRRMRRNAALAVAAVVLTIGIAATRPDALGDLLQRFIGAFSEVGQFAKKISGAAIDVQPGDATILPEQDIRLVAREKGFRSRQIYLHVRKEGDDDTAEKLAVGPDGSAEKWLGRLQVGCNYFYHFAAEKIVSKTYVIKVVERPRIVNMRIEYEFPRYVRRAPIVVGRSDGRIEGLFGSIVILTIEANKPLRSARLMLSYDTKPVEVSLGGKFARATVKLDNPIWLASGDQAIAESYQAHLTCEDGYSNQDSDRRYAIIVKKDRAPEIQFVRLPNRSPEHEVHVLDAEVANVGFYVDARDDYGLRQITFHYRVEDLLSNQVTREDAKKRVFQLPQSEFSAGLLLRLSELRPEVGDRVVFWAEAEDAYDLEPDKGPHVSRTPAYRIAVVTREELFEEVLYKDDWSTTWYDPLKVATLSSRAVPPRMSPTNEPLGKVAEILLDKSPLSNRVSVENQRMVEDYFSSINVER